MQSEDIAGNLNNAILAAILDQAPLGIAVIDTCLRFTKVNNQLVKLMRLEPEELRGHQLADVLRRKRFTADQTQEMVGIAAETLKTGVSYTKTAWKSPASRRYFDLTLKRLEVDGVAIGLLATIADISPHVYLQQEIATYQQQLACLVEERTAELSLANDRFYLAFHVTSALMTIADQQGRIIDANNSFLRVTGWQKDEVIGHTVQELGLCPPDVYEDMVDRFLQDGSVRNQEVMVTTKDGQPCFVLLSLEKIIVDGNMLRLGIGTDITDVKRLKNEMLRLDQLNLVGQMAAGISHEVRNPMTTVRGFLQMLQKKAECQGFCEYFDIMISELDRANSIISEFLSVAKTKPAYHVNTDLNSIIKAIEPLVASDAAATGNTLAVELGAIRPLSLNEKEMRQLLLNLVRNGFEAMEQPGAVTVRTYEEDNQVVLAVEDQGAGIPPEILAKLGTPFLTSKNNGTGLGLAVCYGIVKRHKGTIEVTTGAGGTTFYIRFNQ